MPDFITCSHCSGEGQIELTGVHADTLALLRRQSAMLDGVRLAKIAKVNATAMNNRLAWLEGHGLAERTRYGRVSLWKAVK